MAQAGTFPEFTEMRRRRYDLDEQSVAGAALIPSRYVYPFLVTQARLKHLKLTQIQSKSTIRTPK
jgi:hypothetical protein